MAISKTIFVESQVWLVWIRSLDVKVEISGLQTKRNTKRYPDYQIHAKIYDRYRCFTDIKKKISGFESDFFIHSNFIII
jgi:hypothetical protein